MRLLVFLMVKYILENYSTYLLCLLLHLVCFCTYSVTVDNIHGTEHAASATVQKVFTINISFQNKPSTHCYLQHALKICSLIKTFSDKCISNSVSTFVYLKL
jgi:hypothetical protein